MSGTPRIPRLKLRTASRVTRRCCLSLEAATEEQRDAFRLAMGPFAFDFDGMVGLRLSEHVLHTWDIEVAAYPRRDTAQ